MASRYAGDFFGISLTDGSASPSSKLLSYFPELAAKKIKTSTVTGSEKDGAKVFGGYRVPPGFFGFGTRNEVK